MRYPGMLIAIRFLYHNDSGIRIVRTEIYLLGGSQKFPKGEKWISP